MKIVFFVFDRITALDAVGPYEVLARLPGAEVVFAGLEVGVVRTDNRSLGLSADVSIDDIGACDLLVVPGGFGTRVLEREPRVTDWIRRMDGSTRITASVCTGALLLGAAGVLVGRRANTHWAVRERLAEFGAVPVADRVVRDGKYATAAGVSAGIDLALALAIEIAGPQLASAIQLGIEYDPDPPLDAGHPDRVSPEVRDAVRTRIRERS